MFLLHGLGRAGQPRHQGFKFLFCGSCLGFPGLLNGGHVIHELLDERRVRRSQSLFHSLAPVVIPEGSLRIAVRPAIPAQEFLQHGLVAGVVPICGAQFLVGSFQGRRPALVLITVIVEGNGARFLRGHGRVFTQELDSARRSLVDTAARLVKQVGPGLVRSHR